MYNNNTTMDKTIQSPSHYKSHKSFVVTQLLIRVFVACTTLVAGIVMFTSKESAVAYGIEINARYSYSPAFMFFAYANIAVFVVSLATLIASLIFGTKVMGSSHYFYMFVHDLILTILLVSACAAATAIGYVGKYGNTHTGWVAICDHFGKFCNKIIISVVLSYLGLIFSFILTISSANKIRRVQA